MRPANNTRRAPRRWGLLGLGMLLLLTCAAPLSAQTPGAAPIPPLGLRGPRPIVWKDFLGVNVQLMWFDATTQQQQIAKLRALGLQWIRMGLHWDLIEPTAGNIRWSTLDPVMSQIQANGLKAEVTLVGSAPFASSAPTGATAPGSYPPADPKMYAASLAALARHYPSVPAWQVWNEPNLPAYWAPGEDPEAYNTLLLASSAALREAAPNALVVNGGMAYYSQMPTRNNSLMILAQGQTGLYATGAVIAYHPYALQPEGDDPASRDFVARVAYVSQQLRGNGVRQIWADEWGWSSYAGPVEEQPIVGEQGQAQYLLRRLALISALDIDRTFIFTLSDLDARATVRDRSYGLLRLDATAKPAYTALANFLQFTGPSLLPADQPGVSQYPSGIIGIPWTRPDGSHLWMVWASESGPAVLQGISRATLYDPLSGRQSTLVAGAGGLQVPVTTNLQLLSW